MVEFRSLPKLGWSENANEVLAIEADFGGWNRTNLLYDLPNKWDLSFIGFVQTPVCFCIISRKWPERAHIHRFMVTADRRRTGVGLAMMNEAIQRADGLPLSLKVDPANAGAIEFYHRQGFAEMERDEAGMIVMIRI